MMPWLSWRFIAVLLAPWLWEVQCHSVIPQSTLGLDPALYKTSLPASYPLRRGLQSPGGHCLCEYTVPDYSAQKALELALADVLTDELSTQLCLEPDRLSGFRHPTDKIDKIRISSIHLRIWFRFA